METDLEKYYETLPEFDEFWKECWEAVALLERGGVDDSDQL